MNRLETNDWLVLNDIIYKIYTSENFDAMRGNFLEQIKLLLDFDSADFFLSSTDGSNRLCSPVAYNCDGTYSEKFDTVDYSRGVMHSGRSMVYRETDIMPDDHRVQTEYYKNVYVPNGWHYSLQMVLAYEQQFLGVVTLYRTIGKDNFVYDDIFLINMLKDHLAFRLYTQRQKQLAGGSRISVDEAVEKYSLTKRERDILILLLNGIENDEICEKLVISVNTLKKHILNIYKKMEINSRIQLFKLVRTEDK